MRANEFLTELFNKPYQLDWDDQFGPKEIHARAYDRQGQYIDINFVPVRDNVTDIEFSKMDNFEETGQGDEIAIFSTVLSAIKKYLNGYQPKIIVFSGKGGRKGESRAKLYQQLINRFARQYGYQQFDLNKLSPEAQKQIASSSSTGFVLRKITKPIEEEVLDEMPLPADWNPAQYGPGTTFKSRLQYALERAKKLGTGSSRVATFIEYEGRPTVLKIAKNQKGLAQNNVEADILSDGYARQLGILIPIIDYDEQNREPTWIHTEMAIKATEQQLCTLMRCGNLRKLVDLANAIAGKANLHAAPMIQRMRNDGVNEADIETMTDYANTLADLTNSFDVDLADLRTDENWGLYKGKPVVIDAGANSDVLNQYYRKS